MKLWKALPRLPFKPWSSAGLFYPRQTGRTVVVVTPCFAGLWIGPVLGGLGTLVVVSAFAVFSPRRWATRRLTGVAIGILLRRTLHGPYGSLFGYLPAVRHLCSNTCATATGGWHPIRLDLRRLSLGSRLAVGASLLFDFSLGAIQYPHPGKRLLFGPSV